MAVKKHKIVHKKRSQLDLTALAQYIQMMNEQPNYIPPTSDIIRNCQDIVRCLARPGMNDNELWEVLPSVEEFLVRVVNKVNTCDREQIVSAVLDKLYSCISDPKTEAPPATSVVLVVLDGVDSTALLNSARWLVEQEGEDSAGLRTPLACLLRWLHEWRGTPMLGNWVLAFIKALEEKEHYELLLEVSIENLVRLFLALDNPLTLREPVADAIFHIMASLRETTDALEKISPHVGRVLVNLAADSGQWSRQLLHNVVDILTAMTDHCVYSLQGDAQVKSKQQFADVISCLERHMPTPGSRNAYQQGVAAWKPREPPRPAAPLGAPARKVGLLNGGNTCYMNSIMQVLLVTRRFSSHVMMNMTAVPYWQMMAAMFAKMMYSVTTKLNPDEFLQVVKPPFFVHDHQHDSSEFLGYLFELLQSYEHVSDVNFDYSRPPVLNNSRLRALPPGGAGASPSQPSGSDSESEPGPNRRSVSPRPESSNGAGSSSGVKRSQPDGDGPSGKKRARVSSYLRSDSYIDGLFGGVLLTRVKCTQCRASSLSRDVFRDLQLAFPDKPEGWQFNVQSLLDFYCSKESLTGENQYECPACGSFQDAERSVLIETTPKYLVLVLKNFKFDPKLQVQTKLMHSVHHNHTVTLPTVRARTTWHNTYTLYAAVIHAGTTLDSGHYYTLAKDGDQWHLYNDELVNIAQEADLSSLKRSSTPYILFYRRSDIRESPAPELGQLPPSVQQTVQAHNKHYVDELRQVRINHP